MKIIFLDIDGVLNSDLWNASHQKEIRDGTLIDEEKVMLLGQLIRSTNARVVLHSGWKFWFDCEGAPLRKEAERLICILAKEGIKVGGVTPDHTTEEIRKRESEREEARKTENVSGIKEAAAVVREFTQISREMHEKIDSLFGEGALRKAFPETKSPTLELAMEFVSVMAPIVEEFLRERNRKISSKYNANRKGANSK